MTELGMAIEAPETGEERASRRQEIAMVAALTAVGALSELAEIEHWFNHSDIVLQFYQNSGKHFLVGYLGALGGMLGSKAETLRGRLGAALIGGLALDAGVEVSQAVAVTGLWHGALLDGRPQDLLGIFEPSQIPGNALDALAAETAAVGAAWQ